MAAIGDGWVDGAWVEAGWVTGANPAWFTAVASGTITLSGSITTADEQHIRTGGRTIVLTITDADNWVSGAAFTAVRQAILDGLNSDGAETFGWNNEVRDKQSVTGVVRTSNKIVTITLTAAAAYDITATETITATVPEAALAEPTGPVIASPTFTIGLFELSCTLSGTVIGATEDDIRAGGKTILLQLTGDDTWVVAGAFGFDLHRQAIIDGLVSDGSELTGWNNEVRDKEVVSSVVRTSDTLVTITLTAAPAYDVEALETITSTIPALALTRSTVDCDVSPTFDLGPVPEVEVPVPPQPGVGGEPEPKRRRRGTKPEPRRRQDLPFTGRGLFPDEPDPEASREPEPEPEPVRPPRPTQPLGPGIDEVAAARARRADAQLAAQRAELEAAREALERREAELRMLAFLEAEQAALAAQARLEAILADDEAVIAAYLQADIDIRGRVTEIVGQLLLQRAQRAADRPTPVLLSLASELLENAMNEKGGRVK
jgi:hypothetical protein